MAKVVSLNQAVGIINSQNGKIFSVVFEKRSTGVDRLMVCRKGVKKHLNGGELKYNPSSRNLISVFDLQANGYRSISVEGIKKVKANGKEYVVR
jgi:hypothetical protein